MTRPVPHEEAARLVYELDQALIDHHSKVRAAKQVWRAETHPTRNPTPEMLTKSYGKFLAVFTASLGAYLGKVREIDDRRV